MAEEMRSDEGKSGKELGLKSNMASPKKVAEKKTDMAGRMKSKGMPYTMSTQTGSFEEGRGMKAKMWGSKPSMGREGGMPVKMWGGDGKLPGAKKDSR